LFDAVMREDTSVVDGMRSNNITQIMSEDVGVASRLVTSDIARGLRSMSSTIGGSVMLFRISPHLTLVSLSILPVVGVSAMLFGRFVKRQQKTYSSLIADANSSAAEKISQFRTVRLNAQELVECEKFEQQLSESQWSSVRLAVAEGLFMGGLFISMSSSLVAVLVLGGRKVQGGELTTGQLTSFGLYSAMLGLGVAGLSSFVAETSKSLVSAQRVLDVANSQPAIPLDQGTSPSVFLGDVEFKDVQFTYQTRLDVQVLDGVSFSLKAGSVVGVVGASGSGKTTIASLLVRLYELCAGSVTIDGADIRTLSPLWLRQNICVVEHHPGMFNGTIDENIRFGSRNASDSEVAHAMHVANMTSFVTSLPDGLNTRIGEHGVMLSGGQIQKIAIARAVLRKPRFLVLDEATSNIDGESEANIIKNLREELAGRTMLVIAHRPSMVKDADEVLVMDKGVVVDKGRFDALLKTSTLLQQLMRHNTEDS